MQVDGSVIIVVCRKLNRSWRCNGLHPALSHTVTTLKSTPTHRNNKSQVFETLGPQTSDSKTDIRKRQHLAAVRWNPIPHPPGLNLHHSSSAAKVRFTNERSLQTAYQTTCSATPEGSTQTHKGFSNANYPRYTLNPIASSNHLGVDITGC